MTTRPFNRAFTTRILLAVLCDIRHRNPFYPTKKNIAFPSPQQTGAKSVQMVVANNWLGLARSGFVKVAGNEISIYQDRHIVFDGELHDVRSAVTIPYDVPEAQYVRLVIDNEVVLFSTRSGSFSWQPRTLGNHQLSYSIGNVVAKKQLNVTKLSFCTAPAPNPPMAEDNNVSITPTTRNFGVSGDGHGGEPGDSVRHPGGRIPEGRCVFVE